MNRAEFMRRLAELLGDVPPTERDEAIQYYNDYFDDAGAENESGIIASLGTPEELARTIKAGLNDGGNIGEFTESGFSGYTQTHKDEVIRAGEGGTAGQSRAEGWSGTAGQSGAEGWSGTSGQSGAGGWSGTSGQSGVGGQSGTRGQSESGGHTQFYGAGAAQGTSGNMGNAGPRPNHTYYEDAYYQRTDGKGIYGGREDTRRQSDPYGQTSANQTYGQQAAQPKQEMSGGMIVLIVIVAVLTSPIWLGLLGGLFGLAVGGLAIVFSVFVAFLAVGAALTVVSIALLVAGIALMFTAPLGGLCVIGTSLVLFALGLVFIWLMVLMAAAAIPALVKGIAALGRKLFHRGGAQA